MQIGEVLGGKYRLDRLIGDGGMGTVYEAEHVLLGVRVALKVLHSELARRPGLGERFLQEARVAAQIRSPYVVQVTDVDKTPDGTAYLVMELLTGEPLSSLLERDHTVSLPTACEFTLQMLHALEAAHALGVIHRDLKPENVFVTSAGGARILKLIDFGIAKLRSPGTKNMTAAGVLMGTAEYMAPEQVHAASDVDGRSDLYSVGVLLFEMLAGRRPVAGDNAVVIALKVQHGDVVSLAQVAPQVPAELVALVHRAMAAKPEHRFASATEMRLALEQARDNAALGRPGRTATGQLAQMQMAQMAAVGGVLTSVPGATYPTPGHLGTGTELGAPLPEVVRAAMGAGYANGAVNGNPVPGPGSTLPLNGGTYNVPPPAYGPPGGGYGPPPGAPLAVATPYGQMSATPRPPVRTKKRFPWWALITAVVLGVAVVGGILGYDYYSADDEAPPRPVGPPLLPQTPVVTPPTVAPNGGPVAPADTNMAPLAPPQKYIPAPAGSHHPHPAGSASGAPSGSVAPQQPQPGIPGLQIPGWPNPFPSGIPGFFPPPGPAPANSGGGQSPDRPQPPQLQDPQ